MGCQRPQGRAQGAHEAAARRLFSGQPVVAYGAPNQVWSYDFVVDETEDSKRFKRLPICDEFTRESVAFEVEPLSPK
jgi:hypothetical protein